MLAILKRLLIGCNHLYEVYKEEDIYSTSRYTGKRYHSGFVIVNRCTKCGKIHVNRVMADD